MGGEAIAQFAARGILFQLSHAAVLCDKDNKTLLSSPGATMFTALWITVR